MKPRCHQSQRPHRPQFTLIEMVSALAIMALIISITVVGVRFAFYINCDKKSRAVFKQLEIAFDQYFADYHCYPSLPVGIAPNDFKNKGYVPMGVVTWLETTTTADSTGPDGEPIAGVPTTSTGNSSVTWFYYTPSGQLYYDAKGAPQTGNGALKTETASFFRATLNRPPNNYNPYIEDALTPANVENYTKDGFGQTIYYRSPGLINTSAYDLWSAGADGYFGLATDTSSSVLHVYGSSTTTPLVHIKDGSGNTSDPDDYVNWRKN